MVILFAVLPPVLLDIPEYLSGNILYSHILFIHGGALCVKSES